MKKYIILLLLVVFVTGCGTIKTTGCKNCVFGRFNEKQKIGSKLESYEKDYKKINNNAFLGYVLGSGKKIEKSYICGINNKKAFCIEGNIDKTKYASNKKVLNEVYGKDQCKEEPFENSKMYTCYGRIVAYVFEEGANYLGPSLDDLCYAFPDGSTFCYKEENKKK